MGIRVLDSTTQGKDTTFDFEIVLFQIIPNCPCKNSAVAFQCLGSWHIHNHSMHLRFFVHLRTSLLLRLRGLGLGGSGLASYNVVICAGTGDPFLGMKITSTLARTKPFGLCFREPILPLFLFVSL